MQMKRIIVYAAVCLPLHAWASSNDDVESRILEIHYINVGQGGSTLIKGPDGITVLYDFGNYRAGKDLIPYLKQPDVLGDNKSIDYAILSHNDRDHYTGYLGLIDDGYDILIANYSSGWIENSNPFLNTQWLSPTGLTRAGQAKPIPVGETISLHDGAEIVIAAANGRIIGQQDNVSINNKNDASISLLLRYHNFQFILDGDLGSGPEECTEHQTDQTNLQVLVAQALIEEGYLDPAHGVDVLHIAHHGSESSTSSVYYNLMKPTVGVISVGIKNDAYRHPREDVVERVLIGGDIGRSDCVSETPPLEYLFQTEDGSTKSGLSSTGRTSNAGISSGDIVIRTDGDAFFDIYGSNRVHGGKAEFPKRKFIRCALDEIADELSQKCTELDAN